MIKAPFNFVPLPDTVVLPQWSKQVSQDIPFEDGVSGIIHLTINAETDIFVRNGHNLGNVENEFSHIGNSYFIPGTTLKGCFRNTLEILSFGKIKQFNQHSFAIRDLRNETYKELILKNSTYGGWLYLYEDKFYIFDCGEIKDENRISVQDIDQAIGQSVFSPFIKGKIQTKDKDARKKYKMLAQALSSHCNVDPKQYENGERFFEINGKFLVFTGQPSQRQQKWNSKKQKMVWSGKWKEFLFNKSPQDIRHDESIEISSDDIKAFQSIHDSSTDYTEFWKSKLVKGKPIPVFFQKVENNKHCEHYYIGLSYMFKYPAKDNVGTAIGNYYERVLKKEQIQEPDMADLIFGYQQDGKSLRGRVLVGHAFAQENPQVVKEKLTFMLSPRPSYYPLYLKWDENPVTWNDCYGGKIEVAGYKRYPVRKITYGVKDKQPGYVMGKMESSMIPLRKGTKFTNKIMFHNLLPVELGALLYAITLSDPKQKNGKFYHSIGACKPYGYGKVAITYTLDISDGKEIDFYNAFTDYMQKMCRDQWIGSATIREVQAMASEIPNDRADMFTYMELNKEVDNEKVNEFVEGQKSYNAGERLGFFSEILAGTVHKGIQTTLLQEGNSQKFKSNVSNKAKPQHNQRSNYSIRKQENDKGWKLEQGKTYTGIIMGNGMLLIYYPFERNPNKTIKCRFSEDDFSKSPGPNSKVTFEIVRIVDDESVMIHIKKYNKLK